MCSFLPPMNPPLPIASSRPVASPQTAPHRLLAQLVAKHAAHAFRKPPAPYSLAAFERFLKAWDRQAAPILDVGCGTGESTCALARAAPRRLVVGIDQSAMRLARAGARAEQPANALFLRADAVDFWTLLAGERIAPHAQYLLYPNPWPKPRHVMRRWPAHPIFPTVLALGGHIECRSNWQVYVEEFAQAVNLLTGQAVCPESFVADVPLTLFERKYLASGHRLYRATLAAPALSPGAP